MHGRRLILALRLLFLSCSIQRHYSWNLLPRVIVRWFNRRITISSDNNSQETIDEHFMNIALMEAKRAGEKYNEVPIGAVIVHRNQGGFAVLAKASNRVETFQDASAHAELLAMRAAAKRINNWRLVNTTLYTTLEPCPLCLSASLNFRVSRIVYGAPDVRLGAVDTLPNSLMEQHPFHSISDIRSGVLSNQSADLLQTFFRKRRADNKMNRKKAIK